MSDHTSDKIETQIVFTLIFYGIPTLQDLEDAYYKKLIEVYGYRPHMIAKRLGIAKTTVYRKLASFKSLRPKTANGREDNI